MTVRVRVVVPAVAGAPLSTSPAPRTMTWDDWLTEPELFDEYCSALARWHRALYVASDGARTRRARRRITSESDTADVLAVGLADVRLPVPVVLDVTVDARRPVRLEFDLPSLAQMPTTRPDAISERVGGYVELSHHERQSLYWTFSAGLVLRLAREAFSILPHIRVLEVVGTRPAGDGAEPVLTLRVNRQALALANLEHLHALETLRDLGGQLTRRVPPELIPASEPEGPRAA